MYFLDNAGFFSLVSLIVQCGLAWIFAAFFWSMSPERAVWVRQWRAAFLGLGIALSAVVCRFLMAHRNVAGEQVVEEGELLARASYGLYLAGKAAFAWCLIGGIAGLRQRPWGSGHRFAFWALLVVAAGVGCALPTVESVLLFQAPFVATGFAYAAWMLLRDTPPGSAGLGCRVAGRALAVWAVLWLLYGAVVLVVGPVHPDLDLPWGVVLRFNALVDLGMQVVLAIGLIVLVMQTAQDQLVQAVRERDRLREQLELGERLRALSTVVGGVAHEINNPLTAILGFAGDLGDASPEVRQNAAQVVTEQAERCRAIVQRLALLGRQRAPRPVHAGVDLLELVHRVARGMQRQFDAEGVELTLDLDISDRRLYAEVTALEQVLTNLLTNAQQASKKGQVVTLRLRCTANGVRFQVEDHGPGVPQEQQARVFEPFWTSKREGQGSGLGLAIARSLVESHGGTIGVERATGGGACFVVTLPWGSAEASEPLPARAGDKGDDLAGLRLLVVDDEAMIRRAVARYATAQGWAVDEAACAEDALALALGGEAVFDAVVCDLRMPGLSGAGFYEQLEQRAPHLLRRVLFVTGDLASPEAVAFAARCRAPIVAKPFVVSELFGRLRQVVRSA